MAVQAQLKGWTEMTDPPKLSTREWNITGLVGVVLIVMAVLQAIGFGDFRDWLESVGLGSPAVWAVGIIVAELWAAVGFFKLPVMTGFRMVSGLLAILVAGFWFVQNLRLVSEGAAGELSSSGLFGKFLEQSPGWWTVIEVTALLFLVAYGVNLVSGWSKK
ncbi:MAG TPA: hypothetical protein VI336_03135 [Candidatus Saccharimonadales bacterium]|nr:hypothetical protein [Candidatus Saccharimonadales bacterium]